MQAIMLLGALLAAGTDEVKLTPIDLAGYAKEIAGLKGKPVAVDFWATYCVPCRKHFPEFVALAAKHKGAAAFLSVSIDDEDAHDKAAKYLVAQKAAFRNFRMTSDADDVEKQLGLKSVPRYLVYDAAGAQAYAGDSFEKAAAKLAELVAAGK